MAVAQAMASPCVVHVTFVGGILVIHMPAVGNVFVVHVAVKREGGCREENSR